MCDCLKKLEKKFINEMGCEEANAPVEILSRRAYLTFTVKEKGKKTKQVPVLLSKCPVCGKEYEIKEVSD